VSHDDDRTRYAVMTGQQSSLVKSVRVEQELSKWLKAFEAAPVEELQLGRVCGERLGSRTDELKSSKLESTPMKSTHRTHPRRHTEQFH